MEGIFPLTLLVLLLPIALGFSLQGHWMMTEVDRSKVSIPVSIIDFAFRNETIIHRLIIEACQPLKYMASVDQNNLYIDIDSELVQQGEACSDDDVRTVTAIRKALRRVLKFDIDGPKLTLIDVFSSNAASLVRKIDPEVEKKRQDILGSWVVSFRSASRSTHVLLADSAFIQVCGATFAYNLMSNYRMSTKNIVTGSCRNSQVVSDFGRVAYYRKFGDKIEFYDSGINLLLSGHVDPDAQKRPPPVHEVAEVEEVDGVRPGSYILLLLLRRDLPRARIEVTASQFKLRLCTELIFQYTATEEGKIEIQTTSIPDTACRRADESIYLSMLTSASSFTKSEDGSMTLLDDNGIEVVGLAS